MIAFSTMLLSVQLSTSATHAEVEPSGIYFQDGTIQQALDLAKKQNKIVFVDVFASWCGPCKMLKKSTFVDPMVGEFFNQKFINVAIDAEKGEGIDFAAKYNVRSYPTLLFIRPDGTIVHKAIGFHNAKDFKKLGESVVNLIP